MYDTSGRQVGASNREGNREQLDTRTPRVFARLWRISRIVRGEQEVYKISQNSLKEGKEAITKVQGVIYAIVHIKLGRIYVGQTSGTAAARFKGHVGAARQMKHANSPLYKAMRKHGLDDFYIFPLEKVNYCSRDKKDRKGFRRRATPREVHWINRLRSWKPEGFNVEFSYRVGKCRHSKAKGNPMKHRRARPVADPEEGRVETRRRVAKRSRQERGAQAQEITRKRTFGYHDLERRSVYLLEQEVGNRWGKVDLGSYRSRNVRRILGYIQLRIDHSVHRASRQADDHVPVSFADGRGGVKTFKKKHLFAVVSKLREGIVPVARRSKGPTIDSPIVFLLEWDKGMCRGLPLLDILRNTEGLPRHLRDALQSRLIIAKRLRRTLGSKLWNHKKAARTYESCRVPSARCPCRRLFHEKYRPGEGCVMTMDTSIVEDDRLRALFDEGGGFRENARIDYWQTFSTALSAFVSKIQKQWGLTPGELAGWTHAVEQKVRDQIPSHGGEESMLEKEEVAKAWQQLSSRLVICPTDKAPKNFTFVCRNKYKHVLKEELHQVGGAYSTTDLSPKAIYERYEAALRDSKCPSYVYSEVVDSIKKERFSLPLLYWLPKMHKAPPKARFIAASFKVMTTKLAVFLNITLKLITKELKGKDLRHIGREGYRRCFAVDGYEEVLDWLRAYVRPQEKEGRSIATYDFSTMYTTIDLVDLVDKVGFAVREAFEGHLGLCVVGAGVHASCSFVDDAAKWEPEGSNSYTAQQVIDLISILVNSTYIANGRCIRQQTLGLPMGTNPAPPLANHYCYGCEAPAMDRLYREVSKDIARKFIGTNRLIDDTLATDNPFYERNVIIAGDPHVPTHPIYSPTLTLNRSDADFLGMLVGDGPGNSFYIKVSSKQKKLPFPLINYPSIRENSNFPSTLAYGVFTGMLHRFQNICTSMTDFVDETVGMCKKLVPKGYKYRRLNGNFQNFVRQHNAYKTRPSTIIDLFHNKSGQR